MQDRRVALLRGAFKGLLTVMALSAASGLSSPTIYRRPSPEALSKVAEGAMALFAELQHKGVILALVPTADRLSAWLADGRPDPGLEDFLRLLSCLRLCPRCQPPRLVPLDEWVPPTGRCRRCHNAKTRDERTPGSARFRRALMATMGALRALDPEAARTIDKTVGHRYPAGTQVLQIVRERDPALGEGLANVLRDPSKAVTGRQVEEATQGKLKAGEVQRRIRAALGLSKRTSCARHRRAKGFEPRLGTRHSEVPMNRDLLSTYFDRFREWNAARLKVRVGGRARGKAILHLLFERRANGLVMVTDKVGGHTAREDSPEERAALLEKAGPGIGELGEWVASLMSEEGL